MDIGTNLTLKCPIENVQHIMWEREGKEDDQKTRLVIQADGSLFLENVTQSDSGVYSCLPQNTVSEALLKSINVTVRSMYYYFSTHYNTIKFLMYFSTSTCFICNCAPQHYISFAYMGS